MAERKEFRPKVIPRQKIQIPHFASGGLFAGLPHYAAGGQQPVAVNGGMIQGTPSNTNLDNNPDVPLEKYNPYAQAYNWAGNEAQKEFQGVGGWTQGLANAFTAQNQYQAQLAPTIDSNYTPVMQQGANNAFAGYGDFQANQMRQAQLAQALQAMANGQGPNPAQAMLQNATGSNIAAQSAQMASNRGAGANAGLIARQAAMAGSGIQQNAAGQAAALQAQQSANALSQQGQLLGQMGNQGISEQGINAGLFNAAGQLQNTQNANTISNYGMAQGLNQKTAQSNADASNKTMGSLMNGAGSALSMFMAKGGEVPDHVRHVHSIYHADGGEIVTAPDFKGVQQKIGNWATDGMSAKQMDAQKVNADPRISDPESALPSDVKTVAAPDFRDGGRVPGRAVVAGDSLKNDIQPAMLSPKEIVLPRSVTLAPDAPEKAKEFVEALLKKQGHGNSKHHKEFHKALKDAILSRKKKSGA